MSDTEKPPEGDKPPWIIPTLKGPPKITGFYWCDFPKDAHLPEMWKRRPVIVISRANHLRGAVTVIPCSTKVQQGKHAFPLRTTIDNRAAWALCDKPTTVAVSRLTLDKGGRRHMPYDEFQEMLALLYDWLPKIGG